MATYFDINGQKVQYLASDPSPVTVGQVWYNSTSNTAKVRGYAATGTFSAGASLSNTHKASGASGTSATSALVFGNVAPGPTSRLTESYDGTSWTAVNPSVQDMDYANGFGTQTSAVAAGDGCPTGANSSSLWDGTCWTNSNPTTTYSYARVGLGTGTTLGALYGGTPTGGSQARVENWNGTSWTAGTAMGSGSSNMNAAGVVPNAALIFGGNSPVTGVTQLWNGSSWATVNSLNNNRGDGAGSGVSTNALYAGGGPGNNTNTETWDGTCWSANPGVLSTARSGIPNTMASATNSSTLVAGGSGPPGGNAVEEWTGPGATTQTITVT